MWHLVRALPVISALITTPALGAPADEHAVHHPDAPAAPAAPNSNPKASDLGCPGATGQTTGAHMANSQTMTEHMKDHMANGRTMGGSAAGQGMGAGGMMAGGSGGQGMAGGQIMGDGQSTSSGMMAGGQNTKCPHVGKPAANGKK